MLVKNGFKTQFRTDIVKRYKSGESSYQISKNECCSYNAVLRGLKKRGIDTGRRFWKEEEIKKLKELYCVVSDEELLKEFPDRTKETIKSMAKRLGLERREIRKVCKGCGVNFIIKCRRKYNTAGFCLKCAKRQWESDNLENGKKRKKQWLQGNPEYLKQYIRRPEVKAHRREYQKRLRGENLKFRLDQNMCNFIRQSLKGKKAGRKWEILVGYSLKDLMSHLEKQFDDKMNWDNYGSYWWVDHIKPRSLFKYTTTEEPEFKECWALKNLQPLEKIANIKKGNSF